MRFEWSLWHSSLLLAAIGLIDSIYLTWVKLAGAYASCFGIGNCELVNQSRFSELWGQPIALLGAGAYLLIIALLWVESRRPSLREASRLGMFGMTTFGLLFSGYLTYIEIAVLRAICPYCVLSALVMSVLWVLAILRLRQDLSIEKL
jgi:uncharacterized membrane protein